LDPVEMAARMTSIGEELPSIIADFGAERVVLDSVSLLELMFETASHRRNALYDFTDGLRRAGVTTMLTSEAHDASPYVSKFKMVEYLTDAVFILRRIRRDGGDESGLAVEIMKIRDAEHVREAKPLELTPTGMEVFPQANIY
ncbi:MAG: RAD55 family ATPase, partial [Halobacteriota archaeon]